MCYKRDLIKIFYNINIDYYFVNLNINIMGSVSETRKRSKGRGGGGRGGGGRGGGGRRTRKARKRSDSRQFLYNPNDPKKSFDVYIDKNPKDTIPISYKTVGDVKRTVRRLERLYKSGRYSHKRIWQVGMIMKVRLAAMLKHRNRLKNVDIPELKKRANIAEKYFRFLGSRTKAKTFGDRSKMIFRF